MGTSEAIPIFSHPVPKFSQTSALLICGILSSLLYVAMNIFVAMQWKEYSSVTQTVSELSAIDAPTRNLWIWPGYIYALLIIAFGIGVRQSPDKKNKLSFVGGLLIAYGIVSLIWPIAPMHLRGEEPSFTDTLHILFAAVTVILMFIAMGVGMGAFGVGFKIFSVSSILILLIFGTLTGMESPGIAANTPTPMIGVWERINIGVFLLWIVVLSVLLLQKQNEIHAKRILSNSSEVSHRKTSDYYQTIE